ncbi:MAG TPA: nicotinate-nucleotide--dimethylbenzimidazole phosphoribosyltransferase [Terriglobia bacterium]|nr:nicotinate-nucleotide--dimethylbenzimidazole phosphoribosyltransferase [Terriglobia bacterium]
MPLTVNQHDAAVRTVQEIIASIRPLSPEWQDRAWAQLNDLTKPIGSLGRLESIAARLAAIQETESPQCSNPAIFTLAADHGVTEEGVSAYPKTVTRQMVLTFLSGGAAINVLCRHCGIDVVVVDMGVDGDFDDVTGLLKRKVAHGTRNMAHGPAMTEEELQLALSAGIELAAMAERQERKVIGAGEMGIGNSTAASALTAALTGKPAAEVTGSGTGLDDARVRHKIRVIEQALAVNRPDPADPMDTLRKVGGLEVAGLTGLILGAATRRIAIVVDGFISTSAAAVACAVQPRVSNFIFAAHRSIEPGHSALLEFIQQKPLLDLEMRLGEGTGAALAIHIIQAASKIMNEMATFSSAGVSGALA